MKLVTLTALLGLFIVVAAACGGAAADIKDQSAQVAQTATSEPSAAPSAGLTPEQTAPAEAEATVFEGTVEEVESLLSGSPLERYRGLPEDYREALAAYLALGVSSDLIPAVVEQRMALWPKSPEPLSELLGPEGYARFQELADEAPKGLYHAFFLLTTYTAAHANEGTPEARQQAVVDLLDAIEASGKPKLLDPTESQEESFVWPPIEGVLTPAALAKLELFGPNFQRSMERFFENEYPFVTDPFIFALFATQFELGLLKATAGLELAPIADYLSADQLAELNALPEDIKSGVEPSFHSQLVLTVTGPAIYKSRTTNEIRADYLRRRAESELELAKGKAMTRPPHEGSSAKQLAAPRTVPGAAIEDVIDEKTNQMLSEVSAEGQALILQIWERITATAPESVWEEHVSRYVKTLHEQEHGQ